MPKKNNVSIVIVYYEGLKVLQDCLNSIDKYKSNYLREVVVVDNSPANVSVKKAVKKYRFVKYVKSKTNIGYSKGNNLGVSKATGDYVFILNPDTTIYENTLKNLLYKFNAENVGIVAPTLLTKNNKRYEKQGTGSLGPLQGLVALSFLDKLFPNNFVSRRYWLKDYDNSKINKVAVVPGTAFMIRRKVFDQVGGFDENFFLYFEESDLCRRVKLMGLDVFLIPDSKVMHIWKGADTTSKILKNIFSKSRHYYFEKHYGKYWANLIDFVTQINKQSLFNYLPFLFSVLVGVFLYTYKLNKDFYFSSEVADNLLAVKNAIETKTVPLIGPPTSHPWLNFGPLYYWLMAPLLLIFNFNPIVVPFGGVIMGTTLVIINYFVLSKVINKTIAGLSSLLIAISPLIINFARVGRFFFVVPIISYLVIYELYKIFNNKSKSLTLLGFYFGLFFHFHYSALVLLVPIVIILFLRKNIIPVKNYLKGFVAFGITLLPIVVFDASHGFVMFLKFLVWIPYRVAGFIGLVSTNNFSVDKLITSFFILLQFLTYSVSSISQINLPTLGYLVLLVYIFYKKMILININSNFWRIYVSSAFLTMVIAFFLHGDAPIHYFLPVLTLPLIIMAEFMFTFLKLNKRMSFGNKLIFIFTLLLIIQNFLAGHIGTNKIQKTNLVDYVDLKVASKTIVKDAEGDAFSITRVGDNDNFNGDFAQNYQYLMWLYGNEPVGVGARKTILTYTIFEKNYPRRVTFDLGKIKIVKND